MTSRIPTSTLGIACMAALAGCTGQPQPTGPADSPFATTSTSVGASVAPRAPRLAYQGFGKELSDPAVRALPETAVAIDVSRGRRAATTALRRTDAVAPVMHLSDDGRLDSGGEFPGPIVDLVESLPPPNTQLEVGKPYQAGAPDQGYLDKAFDEGSMVVWQVTRNTPLAIYSDGDRKLVALDVVGYNRGYFRDAAGVHERDMGPAFRARTDLAYTPETGWVVLRLRRVVQSEVRGDAATMDFTELVAAPHSEFNACLDVAIRLDSLTAGTDAEFSACHESPARTAP